jgi:hypothetical protein
MASNRGGLSGAADGVEDIMSGKVYLRVTFEIRNTKSGTNSKNSNDRNLSPSTA